MLKKKAEREELMRQAAISSKLSDEQALAENEEILRKQREEEALVTDEI